MVFVSHFRCLSVSHLLLHSLLIFWLILSVLLFILPAFDMVLKILLANGFLIHFKAIILILKLLLRLLGSIWAWIDIPLVGILLVWVWVWMWVGLGRRIAEVQRASELMAGVDARRRVMGSNKDTAVVSTVMLALELPSGVLLQILIG